MLKSNDPWAAIYLVQVVKKKIMIFEDENLPVRRFVRNIVH